MELLLFAGMTTTLQHSTAVNQGTGTYTMLGQGQQLCRGYGCPVIHGYYAGWHTCYYIRLAIHRVCQKM